MKILSVDGQFAYIQRQEPENEFRRVDGKNGKFYGCSREYRMNHYVFLSTPPNNYVHTVEEWIEFESKFEDCHRYDMKRQCFNGCSNTAS